MYSLPPDATSLVLYQTSLSIRRTAESGTHLNETKSLEELSSTFITHAVRASRFSLFPRGSPEIVKVRPAPDILLTASVVLRRILAPREGWWRGKRELDANGTKPSGRC